MLSFLSSQASRTVMDSNKSTASFEIPRLTAQQGGLWECRVSTNGGQDSRKFNLTIKGLCACVWPLFRICEVNCFDGISFTQAHHKTANKDRTFQVFPMCLLRAPCSHYCSQTAGEKEQAAPGDACGLPQRRWPHRLNQAPLQACGERALVVLHHR